MIIYLAITIQVVLNVIIEEMVTINMTGEFDIIIIIIKKSQQ